MLSFRTNLREGDPQAVASIAASTGFFDNRDVKVNFEIATNRLHHQDNNHQFMFAEYNGKTVAYACYCELLDAYAGTYELYWLSTQNEYRGLGIGRSLVQKLVMDLRRRGAGRLYVKTESSSQYEPTRRFYESCGFRQCAILADYYGQSDDCCIYCLDLNTDVSKLLAGKCVVAAE